MSLLQSQLCKLISLFFYYKYRIKIELKYTDESVQEKNHSSHYLVQVLSNKSMNSRKTIISNNTLKRENKNIINMIMMSQV